MSLSMNSQLLEMAQRAVEAMERHKAARKKMTPAELRADDAAMYRAMADDIVSFGIAWDK